MEWDREAFVVRVTESNEIQVELKREILKPFEAFQLADCLTRAAHQVMAKDRGPSNAA